MLDQLAPRAGLDFAQASRAVVDYLAEHVPMGMWTVSRYDGARQVYLELTDTAYGLTRGDAVDWDDTFCTHMSAGRAPQIAGDAMADPVYRTTAVAREREIGAYVGIPLRWADGQLFGTLCGLDPAARGDRLDEHADLLGLLATLLSAVLQSDHARAQAARAAERAEQLAEVDVLTGLRNRRAWDRTLAREEERHRRFGDPAAVVVVDLDRLKHVNDTGGHAAGDDYLRLAAKCLRESVRAGDLVARLGGDEFAILALDTGPDAARELADRLRQVFDAHGVGASIGFAPYTVAEGFAGATSAADALMYAEKARRRRER